MPVGRHHGAETEEAQQRELEEAGRGRRLRYAMRNLLNDVASIDEGTSDDFDQLTSDDSLSRSVVQNLESVDHVAGVLGGIVHGVAARGDLAGVTLGKRPVERVGEGVFAEVGQDGVVDFGEITRLANSLLRVGFDNRGLVALRVDEAVVQDLDAGIITGQLSDLVDDVLHIGKGRHILANTSKAQRNLLGVASAQLRLAFLAEDDQFVVTRVFVEETAGGAGQTGVDTTAKTLVGARDDEQRLLVLCLDRLGLGLLEHGVGGLSIGAGLVHGSLGASEFGRGDNLHRLGDLLDVADGLEAALNFTQGSEVGILDNGGGGSRSVKDRDTGQLFPSASIALFVRQLLPSLQEEPLERTGWPGPRWPSGQDEQLSTA
ncbi:hypothetical protein MRB53_037736 [Persea americana]|nr:hypothetical protein MRB53_037736 [Persea americana]